MKYFGVTLCSFHSFVVGNAPPSPPPSLTALFLLGRRRADGAEEGGARPSLRLRCKFTPSPALSPSLPPAHRLGRHTRVRAPPPLRDREIDFVPPNDIKQAARSRSSARPRSGGVPPTRRPRSFQETEDDGRCPEGARGVFPPLPLSLSSSVADGPSHRADKRRVSATEKDGLCGRGRARTGGRERKGRADDARERKREGGTEPPREGEIEAPSLLPWHAEREREKEQESDGER